MTYSPITPAILIGGAGSRLWPLSRANKPKQFLNLGGRGTMFQDTLQRFASADFAPAWLLAGAETLDHVLHQLDAVGMEPGGIIVEPAMRGTAAAVAAIAVTLGAQDPDALVLVAPADHFIRDEKRFRQAVIKAAPIAREGYLVTFGIAPTAPETGFGYIARNAPIVIDGVTHGHTIGRNGFREKPNLATAEQYIREGHLWNAGIFLFSARAMIEELRQYAPQTLAAVTRACAVARRQIAGKRFFISPDAESFCDAPEEVSIDVAVMEKTDRAAVVPCDNIGWNDIGSLSAVWEVSQKDDSGNVVRGDALLMDVRNSLIHADAGRRIVAAHMENILVVDTEDALIILPTARAQSVKQVVAQLKASKAPELRYRGQSTYHWGEARLAAQAADHCIVMIELGAGNRLTRYACRSAVETWLVTAGALSIDTGDKLELITAGQSINLSRGDIISAVAINDVAKVAILGIGASELDLDTHFLPVKAGPARFGQSAARGRRDQEVA